MISKSIKKSCNFLIVFLFLRSSITNSFVFMEEYHQISNLLMTSKRLTGLDKFLKRDYFATLCGLILLIIKVENLMRLSRTTMSEDARTSLGMNYRNNSYKETRFCQSSEHMKHKLTGLKCTIGQDKSNSQQ